VIRRGAGALLLALGCRPGGPPAGGGPASGGGAAEPPGDTAAPAEALRALPVLPDLEDLDPSPGVVSVRLRAAPAIHTLTDPATGASFSVEGYAYNGSVPGPTLRARVGDRVVVAFENALDAPTTIHWHGLSVPLSEDGMGLGGMDGGGSGDGLVPAGGTRTYSFVVDAPLTGWYHPHFDSAGQVDAGLYGAIVVEEPGDAPGLADLVVIADDWAPPAPAGSVGGGRHGADGDEGLWVLNGMPAPTLALPSGGQARLRLINASNAGMLALSVDGGPITVLAGDQGPTAAPRHLLPAVLAPGDRMELGLSVGSSPRTVLDAPWSHRGGPGFGASAALLTLVPEGPAAADPGPPRIEGAGPAAPSEDLGQTDILWVFQGSAETDRWFINGEAYPDVTVPEVGLGDTVSIEIRNLSDTGHPFHLHGMAFEVLSVDGLPPPVRTVEDTVDLPSHSVARLRLVADNPGAWMAHCHILPHADNGMLTLLQVGPPGE
jgi:FtsP/CotA-like multicopper oxidase with cupredoxin domain